MAGYARKPGQRTHERSLLKDLFISVALFLRQDECVGVSAAGTEVDERAAGKPRPASGNGVGGADAIFSTAFGLCIRAWP